MASGGKDAALQADWEATDRDITVQEGNCMERSSDETVLEADQEGGDRDVTVQETNCTESSSDKSVLETLGWLGMRPMLTMTGTL